MFGYGHIHTPNVIRYKNKTIFNPGSVGIPIEMLNTEEDAKTSQFSSLASYIILDGIYGAEQLGPISFNLIRLPYDINKEIEYLKATDMSGKDKVIKSLLTAIPQ